jgi:hypothetical protein
MARAVLAASSLAVVLAVAPSALADRLELADGRVVEGTVTKDGETYRVLSRFGESEVPAKDVRAWTKSKSFEAEWRERLAAVKPGDHAGRAGVAKWLLELGRTEEARASASAVLDEDPENAVAHEVLGHVRHKGEWMTPDAAKRADGLEEHGGAWYTPAEWALVDGAAKAKAADLDRAAASRRTNVAVNEAVRLMLSTDKELREVGERRLRTIADETGSDAIRGLVPQVQAYAGAMDALATAVTAESATVLSECRIQMARLKRPIKTFQTPLSSGPGGVSPNAPVTIQLPELELIKLNTTVPIPAK